MKRTFCLLRSHKPASLFSVTMHQSPALQAIANRPTADLLGVVAERPWDPLRKYEGALLKVYDHWCIEISFRQHTPGSFTIFSRHSVERYSQLSPAALSEFAVVTGEIETALTSCSAFRPDRFNYLQMGNALHHLHVHGIPRYAVPRIYADREWRDETYGDPPVWSTSEVSYELVSTLRKDIGEWFLNSSKS